LEDDEMAELNVPRLEGWITLTDASEILGISRWAVHKMCMPTARKPPVLKTVRYVGDPSRPVYIVREAEVKQLKRERDQAAVEEAAGEAAEQESQTLTGVVTLTRLIESQPQSKG
jgi:hypothetical protein